VAGRCKTGIERMRRYFERGKPGVGLGMEGLDVSIKGRDWNWWMEMKRLTESGFPLLFSFSFFVFLITDTCGSWFLFLLNSMDDVEDDSLLRRGIPGTSGFGIEW
jgi:hypothetical protein